jgi:hypothetical protein
VRDGFEGLMEGRFVQLGARCRWHHPVRRHPSVQRSRS